MKFYDPMLRYVLLKACWLALAHLPGPFLGLPLPLHPHLSLTAREADSRHPPPAPSQSWAPAGLSGVDEIKGNPAGEDRLGI